MKELKSVELGITQIKLKAHRAIGQCRNCGFILPFNHKGYRVTANGIAVLQGVARKRLSFEVQKGNAGPSSVGYLNI